MIFAGPSKFSKEQMHAPASLARKPMLGWLGNFLFCLFKDQYRYSWFLWSQVTYEEFVFLFPYPLVTVFNIEPELGNAMLETGPSFVFPLIDIVWRRGSVPAHIRELTDIEITVMKQD